MMISVPCPTEKFIVSFVVLCLVRKVQVAPRDNKPITFPISEQKTGPSTSGFCRTCSAEKALLTVPWIYSPKAWGFWNEAAGYCRDAFVFGIMKDLRSEMESG